MTVASGLPALGAGSTGATVPAAKPEPAPVGRKAKRGKSEAGGGDDMKEIEDILRQRGIT